ncbi:MAG: hypothetical protein HYX92_01160 [Chloroflexi bacterium]|nr:hypothetical protein [Chloroflexota bacterium]
MMRRHGQALIGFVFVLGLVLGCAPAKEATPTTAPAGAPALTPSKPAAAPTKPSGTPSPQPRYGGILILGYGLEAPTLDIHQENVIGTTLQTAPSYVGLVQYDPEAYPAQKIVPDLAKSWEISADGKVYTFHLVEGAKFADGMPVTAEDAKYTLDRLRNPSAFDMARSPRGAQIRAISKTEIVDKYTLRVTLEHAQASLMSSLATSQYFGVVPKHVGTERLTKEIVANGPFKWKAYTRGIGFELVRNPDFFVKGRPYLDGIKGYVIPDDSARFAALRTGSINYRAPMPFMTVAQTKVIDEQMRDKIAYEWAFHPAWYGITFNVKKAPWDDRRVRQAVSLAIDRSVGLDLVLKGAGVKVISVLPPGELTGGLTLSEKELAAVPGYAKADIEAAKKLLEQAGHARGIKDEMLVRSVAVYQDTAVFAKEQLAKVGIDLSLKVVESTIFNNAKIRGDYTISVGAMGFNGTDPDLVLVESVVTGGGWNWSGYSNPRIDELFQKQSAATNPEERKRIVLEMEKIVLDDAPDAPFFYVQVAHAWWKKLRNYRAPAVHMYGNMRFENVWLSE